MAKLNFPFQYKRLNRESVDDSSVFNSLVEFEVYLKDGPAYAGQLVAVRNGFKTPDLYIVNEDFSYSPPNSKTTPTGRVIDCGNLKDMIAAQNGDH